LLLSARMLLRKSAWPLVGSISLRIVRPTVVLPQPLSPTKPSVSPSRTKKETSSTALTSAILRRKMPPWTGKYLQRFFTSKSASGRIVWSLDSGIGFHLRIVQPATGPMAGVRLQHGRRLVTDRHLLRAAIGKAASFGHKAGVGHDAADRRQPLFRL